MRMGWAVAGLAILSASPAAATIPLTGEIYAEANAKVGTYESGDFTGDSWSVGAYALSAGINTNTLAGEATAYAGGDANWASASAGDFNFDLGGSAATTQTYAWSGITRWYYTFTAEADGLFTLNYGFSGDADDLAEASWVLFWGPPEGNFGGVDLSGAAPGSVSRTLLAGQTYEAQVAMSIGAKSPGALAVRDVSGDFTWTISGPSATPEPATWALLITGFGLAGTRLRRRTPRAA